MVASSMVTQISSIAITPFLMCGTVVHYEKQVRLQGVSGKVVENGFIN